MEPFTNWMYPVPQPVVRSPWACALPSEKYPIPFVSPSLDWLAWLGLASLASAWLVSSAAATTTATTPEQAYKTTAAALRSREGLKNGMGYIVVIRHKASPITKPPISDKSNDLVHGQQEGGIVSLTLSVPQLEVSRWWRIL